MSFSPTFFPSHFFFLLTFFVSYFLRSKQSLRGRVTIHFRGEAYNPRSNINRPSINALIYCITFFLSSIDFYQTQRSFLAKMNHGCI